MAIRLIRSTCFVTLILFCVLSFSNSFALDNKKIILGKWAGINMIMEFFDAGTVIQKELKGTELIGDYKFLDENRIKIDFGTRGLLEFGGPQILKIKAITKNSLLITFINKDKYLVKYTPAFETYFEGYSLYQQNKYRQAFPLLRKAAEKEVVFAQWYLANIYDNGRGVEKNYHKGFYWYQKAANKNYREAQFLLGIHYLQGNGVDKNPESAFKWCLRAAKQGQVNAQYFVGSRYSKGYGVKKDFAEAINWYTKAADNGNEKAYNGLAWIYATCSEPRYLNGEDAVKYALKAVKNNPQNPSSMDTLAAAYARNNQFDLAIDKQLAAIKLLEEFNAPNSRKQPVLEKMNKKLYLYRNNEAYTDN